MSIKTFARRDSATAALRKLGIPVAHYNQFIERVDAPQGQFHNVDLDAAKSFLNGSKPNGEAKESSIAVAEVLSVVKEEIRKEIRKDVAASTAKIIKKMDEKKEAPRFSGKRTVSAVCRAMIQDGKTNSEIWAVIKDEFNLGDNKKHYPAWYRSESKRKGA